MSKIAGFTTNISEPLTQPTVNRSVATTAATKTITTHSHDRAMNHDFEYLGKDTPLVFAVSLYLECR